MNIKRGGVRMGLDVSQVYTEFIADGLIGSNSIQYSSATTFGTVKTEVLNRLIDPGYNMKLLELQIHTETRFTNLIDAVGSLTYHWEAREEYKDVAGSGGLNRVTGGWVGISATYTIGIGSLANIIPTLGGFVPVGSIPHAPVRIRLMAEGLVANSLTGEVNNNSFLKFTGNVMPGA